MTSTVSNVVPIRTAILSVSDKLGIVDLAMGLRRAGVRILSTGGTRQHHESSGIRVEDVSVYTGFPELLDGRLKTLHPRIFGGILAQRDDPVHQESAEEYDRDPFDLIVVNH